MIGYDYTYYETFTDKFANGPVEDATTEDLKLAFGALSGNANN